jgi:molybdopterin synthase catalytic subunit
MRVEVRHSEFNPWEELQRHQQESLLANGKHGAIASFVGTMRDFNEGDSVRAMVLEHYPGMTEKYLGEISAEAKKRWDILDTLILHRVGELQPGDPIVLVAVWSAHRAAAFEACRYLIEELKSRAPFWKKESLQEQNRWVQHNTPAASNRGGR